MDELTTDLGTYPGRDPRGNQWRLLLAFNAGQAGNPATAQQLFAPIITGGTTEQQDAAQAVLRALEGSRSDIRLQIIILETELDATPQLQTRICSACTTPSPGTTAASATTRTPSARHRGTQLQTPPATPRPP